MNFSVLMSVYRNDNPDHFRLALNSVTLNQTIKPSQVVIVEDGEVDPKIDQIISELDGILSEIEFTVLKKEKNEGLASALNDGIKLCEYEYIARMDADDVSVPERFGIQCSVLLKEKNIDLLGGYIMEFDNNPQVTGVIRKVGINHSDVISMAKHRTPFNHPSVMYKKSKVVKVGGYRKDFGKLEDYKLWVDMIAAGCVCKNVPEILVKMRVGNGQAIRRSDPREIRDWDRLQKDLLSYDMINKLEVIENKIYIRVFTYMPIFLKKIVYRFLFRKILD